MTLLEALKGGDRRSIGHSEAVGDQVLADPTLFGGLFEGLFHTDPIVRMRTADALEKITRIHPEWLIPYKERLLTEIVCIDQQEVRWHTAQILPRLELSSQERFQVIEILKQNLRHRSSIVRTFSMQALADMAMQDGSLRPAVLPLLEELTLTGTPAMQNRGRKLIKRLKSG